MEIEKQFSFVGNLKKLHEEDNQPIENLIAIIHCYTNGNIYLEIDSDINEKLNNKKFYESAPIYKVKTPSSIDQEISKALLFQLDELEKELVHTPYEGDYIIQGRTFENWFIKANIADTSFTVSFGGNIDNKEAAKNTQKYLVRLSNLHIDYNPQVIRGKALESIYGLSNLEVRCNFSTDFLDSQHEFSLISVYRGKKEAEILSAEIKFRVLDEENAEEISYNTYFAWFELLISFAIGKCIKNIYRVETSQGVSGQKKIEFWSGDQVFIKGSGIAVIQQPHLHLFIKQCASKVTLANFSDKGLGSALRWYVEAFTSNTVSVEFMLLCTVLETLNKHHSSNFSSKLIPTSMYQKIREQILSVIGQYEKDINDENILEKYHIFKTKVEKSFADGSFNQVGSLRTSLKQMLEFYKVPYKDLFPELEFIKIRDKIIHQGFGGLYIAPELRKLANLIVRLILSILKYQGAYIESRRIEIKDEMGCSKHGLTYKTFPFQDEC
ncbi:MAG: hypothetical protein RM368_02065 [Nostoc sp. DedSLP03]|uniref:hypothetical protein n=1 Tax=Nostoc sp. DedSLP03 TaxID=3075400 RepID=UPI002AD4EA23|nr:hypothetical protein [Nostoc sp. DedSLP03]MDZ7963751.1 hypothetical protein [Nostoc sp. DedSLP03]